MPAKAGIQVDRLNVFWIPAFAGMTVYFAENSLTPYLIVSAIEKFEFIICFGFRISGFVFLSTIVLSYHFINNFSLVGYHTTFDNLIIKVQVKPLIFSVPEFLHQAVKI